MLKAMFLVLLLEGSAMDQAKETTAAEVKFSRIAENRAHRDRVRDFAKMLARDHGQIPETNPSGIISLNSDHQKKVDQLSRLSGKKFDQVFIDAIVKEHRQAIQLFEQLARQHGIKTAHDTLPALKQHLQEAEAIQQFLRSRARR